MAIFTSSGKATITVNGHKLDVTSFEIAASGRHTHDGEEVANLRDSFSVSAPFEMGSVSFGANWPMPGFGKALAGVRADALALAAQYDPSISPLPCVPPGNEVSSDGGFYVPPQHVRGLLQYFYDDHLRVAATSKYRLAGSSSWPLLNYMQPETPGIYLADLTTDPTAAALAYAWSRKPWDLALAGILADRCEELGYDAAVTLLRKELASHAEKGTAPLATVRGQPRKIIQPALRHWRTLLRNAFGDFESALQKQRQDGKLLKQTEATSAASGVVSLG